MQMKSIMDDCLNHMHIDVHVKSKTIVVSKKEYEMEVKGHEIE